MSNLKSWLISLFTRKDSVFELEKALSLAINTFCIKSTNPRNYLIVEAFTGHFAEKCYFLVDVIKRGNQKEIADRAGARLQVLLDARNAYMKMC